MEPGQVWIDRRPILVVIASRFQKPFITLGILCLFLLAIQLQPPQGLDQKGFRVFCLFMLCVTYWVSGLLPLSITSLLAIAAIPLLGIMPAEQAYSYFGSSVIFFVLGAFILGAAVVSCGLSTRLAVRVLKRFGQSPWSLVYSVYFLCALMSCLMSEHAVAAMVFPIVVELVRALKLKPGRSAMAKALYFAIAWGCIIGGTTTFLGGGRGPLAIGFLEKTFPGQSIGFMEYIFYNLPLVLCLLGVGAFILKTVFPLEIQSIQPAHDRLEQQISWLGKISWREQGVALVLIATIVLWATVGHTIGLANIALLGVGALFLFRLSTWREIEENVNWAILLTYGGAICLGAAMSQTGAAHWLISEIVGEHIPSPQILLITIGILVTFMTEFMSNSAVIAIMMPAALALAPVFQLDPRVVTMAVILPSNFAFMLPAATPATAMAYSSGAFEPGEALKYGFLLDFAGLFFLSALVFIYWPLIGLL